MNIMTSKKIVCILVVVFAMPFFAKAQMFYAAPKSSVSVVVDSDSYVKIVGKTNVNTFTCDYKKEIPKDTIHVSINQEGNKLYLTNAVLKVRVDGFDCGHPIMNKDFQQLLTEEKHPYITLHIKSIEPSDDFVVSNNPGLSEIGYAQVVFEIAGVKNEYKIPLNSFDQVISQYFLGQKTINIKDFQLHPPKKFLGLVKVDEEISIDFRLNLNFLY
jgi:hypothetical protein